MTASAACSAPMVSEFMPPPKGVTFAPRMTQKASRSWATFVMDESLARLRTLVCWGVRLA